MDNVARSVLTDQLNLLDKKDRLLEDNPDLPPDPIVELGPQFYVEHRIKQVFEEPLEVRNYSLELVACHVSQLRHRKDEMVSKLRMQITESEDTDTTANSNNAIEEEELGNMLNNLGFRLNDACLLSPGDQNRGSSTSSPRSGLLSPKGGSRSHSRNRGSPTAPLSPSESRTGQRLATAAKVSKSKSTHDFSVATQELEPVDPLLDGKYLDKLQQQMEKPSIALVMDQLQNKAKEEPGTRAKSASARKVSKTGSKKLKNKKDHEDDDLLMPSQVRTKLASVHSFKEVREHNQ